MNPLSTFDLILFSKRDMVVPLVSESTSLLYSSARYYQAAAVEKHSHLLDVARGSGKIQSEISSC